MRKRQLMLAVVAGIGIIAAWSLPSSKRATPSTAELARVWGGIPASHCNVTASCPFAGECIPVSETEWLFCYNNGHVACSPWWWGTCNNDKGPADCSVRAYRNASCTVPGGNPYVWGSVFHCL